MSIISTKASQIVEPTLKTINLGRTTKNLKFQIGRKLVNVFFYLIFPIKIYFLPHLPSCVNQYALELFANS